MNASEDFSNPKPWVLILAAAVSGGALSGGGVSLGLQGEITILRDDLKELRTVVNEFMISGPKEVRKSLNKIEAKLENVAESHVKQERYLEQLLDHRHK